MLTAGINKVSDACPVFDGTEYPYWKNKMRMHLEAIDVDLWYVVKNDKDNENKKKKKTKEYDSDDKKKKKY